MKPIIAVAALALLAGCASNDVCVQPDPVEPAAKCWNKGVDCGTGIQSYGSGSEAPAKPAKKMMKK